MTETLEVAVAPVGRQGPRGRWVAIAWTAVLVAAVAAAIGGRATESTPPPVIVAIVVTGPHADPGPLAMPPALPTARIHGEDGLMGSLVFDLKQRPELRRWPVGRLPGWTNPTQS